MEETSSGAKRTMGKAVCFLGPMFAHKTDSLQSAILKYTFAKKKVLTINYVKNVRYQGKAEKETKSDSDPMTPNGSMVSHMQHHTPAIMIADLFTLKIEDLERFDVVAIDECHMFPRLIEFVILLKKMGKHVFVAGLDTTYKKRPTKWVKHIWGTFDSVNHKTAYCVVCGEDAAFTMVLPDKVKFMDLVDDKKPIIGGADMYAAVCDTHHFIPA